MEELFLTIGYILGGIVHMWTVIIAFMEAGFIGAFLSFVFPILSEIYWVFTLWGINDAYVNTAIGATVFMIIGALLVSRQ